MSRQDPRTIPYRLRATAGLPAAVASILTVVIFVASYWLESIGANSDLMFRGIFLGGAVVLCGLVVFGVVYRHFVPVVSQVIVAGAVMIGLSQVAGFLEVLPAMERFPVIGPEGWGYLAHLDDMMLYPGFVLMLCGFYMSILHGTEMHEKLLEEGRQKEEALARSTQAADALARRVDFENLATTISTRFINLEHDEVDAEIRDALRAVGEFVHGDRVHFAVSRGAFNGNIERYEWCSSGIAPLAGPLSDVSPVEFQWVWAALERGEPVVVREPRALPEGAAFERAWVERHGIQSFIRVPMSSRGRLRGYIGLDNEQETVQWSAETVPLLRMIGEILLSAWDRRCVVEQRAALELQVQQAQKLESLGVMAGGIAHDFNNILTGIMGNAELAQLGTPPGDERHKQLDGIIQSARRAAELCQQMLAYSGLGKFLTESFSLNRLVSEMLPLLRASVVRTATLDCELAPELPDIDGDISQFRQILGNLVTNASESFEDGAGQVLIRTGSQYCTEQFLQASRVPEPLPAGEYAYLEVRDTGSGMEEAVLDRIFEPFYTTRFAGRGLGLPAVLGIVRSHRGAIEIDSAPGAGTTVRLYFPARETASKGFEATGEELGDWHGHGTVLLADDEEVVLGVGAKMLKHLGLDVVTAADGEEALARAREHADRLQCVILDLSMPGMDAETMCAQFQARHPAIPIVISSGYMREDIEQRFAGGGIAAFLPKPFELAGIQAIMRDLLDPVSGA